MKKNRDMSFWERKMSILDKLIQHLRIKKISKSVNFNGKDVVDTWSWFNASLLLWLKSKYDLNSAIAIDLKLNKDLQESWVELIEQDLNIDLKIWNNCFDIIISTAILEHLNKPEEYLKSVYNKLRAWWDLIMTVPSIWSKPVLEFLAFKLKLISRNEILDHKLYYDKKLLLNALLKAWFTSSSIKHTYFQFWMNNFIIAKK